MEIYSYNLSPEVIELFQANELKSIASHWYSKFTKKWNSHFNENPATYLFDGVKSIEAVEGGFILNDKTFLEPTLDGIDYRWYDNVDRSKATAMQELVIGDPTTDVFYVNPGVRVTPLGEKGLTVLLENISVINGKSWEEAPKNREFQSYGLIHGVTGVRDGKYGSFATIADFYNGTKVEDWNRGKGRKGWVKISIDPNCALDFNVENEDRFDPFIADYIWKSEDIEDPDMEFYRMVTYTGLKQTERAQVVIPFINLFPQLKTQK